MIQTSAPFSTSFSPLSLSWRNESRDLRDDGCKVYGVYADRTASVSRHKLDSRGLPFFRFGVLKIRLCHSTKPRPIPNLDQRSWLNTCHVPSACGVSSRCSAIRPSLRRLSLSLVSSLTQTAVSLTLFLIAFHPTVHSKWYCTTSIRNFLAYIKIHIQSCDVGRFARSWKYELGKSSLFNSAKFARLPSFRYLPPQRNEGGMWIVDRPTRLLSLRIKRNETVFKRVPARAGQRNRRRSLSVCLSERRNGDGGTTVSVVFAIWSPHSDGRREGRKAKAKSSNNHSAAAEAMCPFLGSTAAAHLGHLGHVNMHIRWGSERRRLPGAVRVAGGWDGLRGT